MPLPSHADGLSATFLAIPYKVQSGDFYYGGTSPVSVEIDGQEILKFTKCTDLTNTLQNLSILWNIGNRTFQESLFMDGGYIHTIGLTKNGIQCAFLNPHGGLFGTGGIYQFGPNEEKVAASLTLYLGSDAIGHGNGYLFNPGYAPQAPQILGISRGDTINGYAKFTLTPNNLTSTPTITLCDLSDSNLCSLGWGVQQPDHSIIVLTNEAFSGKSADLIISWPYRNSTGNYLDSRTDVIIQIGKSSNPIPWDIVKLFKGILYVQPNLNCGPQSAYKGKNLSCKITPQLQLTDSNYPDGDFTSVVNTKVEFNVVSQLDTQAWKPLTRQIFPTGTTSTLTLKVPAGNWNRWIFQLDNGFLKQPQDSGSQTYGELPAGPSISLQFPDFVMWNVPFKISAKASSGTATKCTFSMSQRVLGTVAAKNGIASISVVAVWSGEPGTATNLYYSASCLVSGKSIGGYGFVEGFR